MGIADDLQKLEQLRLSGALTDEEFAKAKSLLLENTKTPATVEVSSFMEEQLTELRQHQELSRLDREWEIERQQYQITTRYGRTFVPTVGAGIMTAVVGVTAGICWAAIAYTITFAFPDVEPFLTFKTLFPLFGLVFAIGAVLRGIFLWVLAHNYATAYAAYKKNHFEAIAK